MRPSRSILPLVTKNPGFDPAADFVSVAGFATFVNAFAVLGGARQAALPDVPTFAELGLAGFEDIPYYGLFAPKGTPQANIDAVGAALAKVLKQQAVHDTLTNMGLTVGYMPQAQLATREKAYSQIWAKIIKARGLAP